ncbi:MAG: sensor histidine kinase [Halorhabdus sp.]
MNDPERGSGSRWSGDALVRRLGPGVGDWELTPWRITGVYLVFGFVGLYVSDVLVRQLFTDPLRSQLQTVKGGLEVLVTAGFIFAITAVSRRQLERTNRRLTRRNDELHVLHRVLRHNLRNDLNVIEGQAAYVEDVLDDESHRRRGRAGDEGPECEVPDEENLGNHCDQIITKAETILEYVERAGQIRRLGEEDTTHTFDLSQIVPVVVDRHDAITDDVDLTVDVPESAPVRATHMLSAAIGELIENAVHHAERTDPSITVRVSQTDAPPGQTLVEVADDGPGLPAYVQTVIESGERDQLAHLNGLGLWFVRWTVTDAGGSLSFDVDESGTTVRLLVPTAEDGPE